MAGIPSEYARDVREALRSVADDPDLGPATLSDAAALSNLLKDLLPDAPREKNLLVAAAEARLAAMMADHVGQGVDAASAIRLAAASFGANTHFTTDACDWVATEFAVALGLADGLTTARAGLPPGDITTARTPATFADSVTAPDTAAAPGESAGSAIAPAPAAKAEVSEVTASAPPAARARTGRAGIGTLVALAADAVLLAAFLLPLFKDPYLRRSAHVWGGGLPWYVASGPSASLVIAVLAGVLLLSRRVGRVLAAAASAALLACGLQLLLVFQSFWQQVGASGDRVGVGLPLGVAGSALLIVAAVTGLVRSLRGGAALSFRQGPS